ncbi:peptidyl-prolyl cis-trans isomerase C [Clostridium acetobutylicum]|uniref:Peptidil-prolyl cis-trans isomerase n=1 Tax=Clostridium acetobutylicum (strain ATCC 824 / DSM 792 / JCM 1419 / IAM 19013 / LMG 5710 / NBRC 13948 / NRRL B-527 / VKM B-1787 / 2291 / W) TaxID=272562 RepID=Q97MB9_CLOAB|nr:MULTISPECIES: peptidylprolyl isomerase [Clostridium]AAK78260.1 Peptidil-prolyl cis-trans isomerase [Clostridium acetobutylicum ATCC 824]ADZ19327.1 Peptidil-prolyl cis-trans isomerase [Clostridium acetobutylicum EA 2018]AEI34573.1 peptidil-prolyl cis-trans isomerase [Clostridium acetobutylicum DSM 1731]AWV82110.1 peptidylprolyl isomerase [Clostridium acetobutylicum]AWV82159.1 peptidylprolyl isomerase [Clostridium acetobutylicum]
MENKVLAVVNGQEITESDLNATINSFPEERRRQFLNPEGRKRLLDEIVSFELVYNDAKDSGIEEQEVVKAQIENARKQILTHASLDKIFSDIVVADSEVEKYYEANKEMFKDPEKVAAKHILVQTEEDALKIREEIKEGKTFEEAAAEYSSCPSKERGGDLGAFTRGQMVPEFEEAAFSQEIGEVGAPVKTQFGYHLIKVEGKIEPAQRDFPSVKDAIKNRLLQERQSMKYSWYIDQLKNKYKVEIK